MSAGSAVGGIFGAQLAKKYAPGFFRKIKVKQLGSSEVERLKITKFPVHYSIIYYVYLFFIIATWVASLFVSTSLFHKLQVSLFAQGAIFFTSTFTPWLFGLLNFFGTIITLGGIFSLVFWFSSPRGLKDFVLVQGIKEGYPFNYVDFVKKLFIIGLIYYLIISPFVFFALRDYKAVYPKKVVVNKFFSIVDDTYGYNDIEVVIASASFGKENKVTTKLQFVFNDNRKVEFEPEYIPFTGGSELSGATSITQMYTKLREEGVTLEIMPPTLAMIRTVRNEYCPSIQRTFFALFEASVFLFRKSKCFFYFIMLI
jgi:hypothetical protein